MRAMNAPARIVPRYVPFAASLAREARFQGIVRISQLPRLVDCLAAKDGDLTVDLALQRERGAPPHLAGTLSGGVTLICQRCLRPYVQTLNLGVDVRPVRSEAEEEQVLQSADPYLISDDRLPLHELIEDEVLLGLPMAPHCEQPDCVDSAPAPTPPN